MARSPRPKKGDLIAIRWFDAWHNTHLEGTESDMVPDDPRIILEDYGIFLGEKEGMVCCGWERTISRYGEPVYDDFRSGHAVPRVNIIEIRIIEKWQRPKKKSKPTSSPSNEQPS